MSNDAAINSYFRVCSNKYYCLLKKKKSHFQGCARARLSLVKRFFQPNPNYYDELIKFNPTQPNPSQGSNLTQPTWIMLDLWVGHFFLNYYYYYYEIEHYYTTTTNKSKYIIN